MSYEREYVVERQRRTACGRKLRRRAFGSWYRAVLAPNSVGRRCACDLAADPPNHFDIKLVSMQLGAEGQTAPAVGCETGTDALRVQFACKCFVLAFIEFKPFNKLQTSEYEL